MELSVGLKGSCCRSWEGLSNSDGELEQPPLGLQRSEVSTVLLKTDLRERDLGMGHELGLVNNGFGECEGKK